MSSKEYNTTQLNPESNFEKHVFHRDYFAHYLRWSYVLNMCDRFLNILDMGCASAELLEVLYRNRRRPLLYTGVDIRERMIEKNKEQFKALPFPVEFFAHDLTEEFHFKTRNDTSWDIITCFEVVEHIPRDKQHLLLENLKFNAGQDTLILISTPNYSEKQGAANNHIVAGEILERTYDEMFSLISSAGMRVLQCYGTFASMKDIENNLTSDAKLTFMKLREYYDVNVLSVMFAPLIPQFSRNVMYLCKINSEGKANAGRDIHRLEGFEAAKEEHNINADNMDMGEDTHSSDENVLEPHPMDMEEASIDDVFPSQSFLNSGIKNGR